MSSRVPDPKTLPGGRAANRVASKVMRSRGLETMRMSVRGACLTILGIVWPKISQLPLVRSSLV